MDYNFSELEKKIQAHWDKGQVHAVREDGRKPKRYILDMFPYPSGHGLHLGHLLGYFASDAQAIFLRLQGFNVLHPMGFDAFGLPAEQHALETGQHPAVTTARNRAAYEKVLRRAGLTFDWSRSFSTTDPAYYRWTQWLFLQLFNSWYDHDCGQARPIEALRRRLEREGNGALRVVGPKPPEVTAAAWKKKSPHEQQQLLACYRLAYRAETKVNWCPALGTVLANDEVKDGFSERGGHPVVQKKMWQWNLRMRPYADRLLEDLDALDWPAAVKTMQRNWIGRSQGALITFRLSEAGLPPVEVFTTRPETLFGVSYVALAPEHPIVPRLLELLRKRSPVSSEALRALETYIAGAAQRSERQRLQESQEVRGAFTHCYAVHPATGKEIPIWLADYVLSSYGPGAVMGVPAHDARDYSFADKFRLPILPVIQPPESEDKEKIYTGRGGTLMHADFLNGLTPTAARAAVMAYLEGSKQGHPHVSYKLRDPVFSRQRCWGEPFPIYYEKGVPYALSADELPLRLPSIERCTPGEAGAPPLAGVEGWTTPAGHPRECNTMPSWAGSSWYFLRYMDPHNTTAFAGPGAIRYWRQVDHYIGGAEHTTGHLLYARFFTKVLYDRGHLPFHEPFQKLINQGMLQSPAALVYRIKGTDQFVSASLRDRYETLPMYVDIRLVKGRKLDREAFKAWRPDLKQATFILEQGHYICGQIVEKMSKSKHNVVAPQAMMEKYGADALRLHLLFLGPITQAKPWNAQGIEGITRFLRKVWALFHPAPQDRLLAETPPPPPARRALHQTIEHMTHHMPRYAFNTCISRLMILVNALTELQAHQKEVLQPLVPLLAPFAPHMAEALWQKIGDTSTIFTAPFPKQDPAYLAQQEITYPIAINGKTRATCTLPPDATEEEIIAAARAHPHIAKRLQGRPPKKILLIPQRMINLVC